MIEIIAFVYFIKQIRQIAEEKGIEAKGWIWKLVLRWLTIDIGVMSAIMYLFNISIEDERLALAAIPAIILSLVSAFYTLRELKAQESELIIVEEEIEEQNFDHFR